MSPSFALAHALTWLKPNQLKKKSAKTLQIDPTNLPQLSFEFEQNCCRKSLHLKIIDQNKLQEKQRLVDVLEFEKISDQ